MRVAIDASGLPRQLAGAGVYTYQLVRALAETPGDERLVVFARRGVFEDLAAKQKRLHVVPVDPTSRPARLAWEQTVLPLLLRRLRVRVLHSPHHTTPAALPGVRRVVTIHDVTFMVLPKRYPLMRRLYMETLTRAAARLADAIITPSQTSRRDIMRKLGVRGERIVVIPYAAGPQYTPVDDQDALGRLRWKHHLPSRFILSVGSLEPGKNRSRLIRAYDLLRREGIDAPLIIVGQPAWRFEDDFALVERLGLGEEVRFLDYVPDDDLPGLYSAATVFAFPSLYEGFGLPVIEAMACGTPVVTSNGSALAEVADDAALLVDPLNVDALAGALRRLLADDGLRADLRVRGLERARKFSWQRVAHETRVVYQVVAAKGA
ncbi:MAG: glycosyltransferase family 1 protein [Dehalococcoidia bacterium]